VRSGLGLGRIGEPCRFALPRLSVLRMALAITVLDCTLQFLFRHGHLSSCKEVNQISSD